MKYRVEDKYFWELVCSCVSELKKSGITFCFHLEQIKEIALQYNQKINVSYINKYYTITRWSE